MSRSERVVAALGVLMLVVYLGWLSQAVSGGLGWTLFGAETFLGLGIVLRTFNSWHQVHVGRSHEPARGSLDVFVTVVDEPLEMLSETLRNARAIDYLDKTVYVLDDGARDEVRALARRVGAVYLRRDDSGRDHKAGNLNFGLAHSDGDFVLVLDADQVPRPEIARDLLGHFSDPKLALIATRQSFDVPPDDFNHEHAFYEQILPGKNADNAAISVGSGVFYRRTSLDEIGGFQTWNVVEDLYTSYVFHTHRFRSIYVSEGYTFGHAPTDLPTIYKQRGTWAIDAYRLLFFRCPLFESRLRFRQRMHYFEIAYSYLASALCIPIVTLLVPLTLVTSVRIVPASVSYLVLKVLSLGLPAALLFLTGGRSFASVRAFVGLSPVYLRGLVLALRGTKIRYQVTDKTGGKGSRLRDVWPHLATLVVTLGAIVWCTVHWRDPVLVAAGVFWLALEIYWFVPFLSKPFQREDRRNYRWTSNASISTNP